MPRALRSALACSNGVVIANSNCVIVWKKYGRLECMSKSLLLGFVLAPALMFAQQKPDFVGDYSGMFLARIPVILHLSSGADGALSGTMDSVTQGLSGMPCKDITINKQTLTFSVPRLQGTWTGFLSADGRALSGNWVQPGMPEPKPMNLTRGGADSQATPEQTSTAISRAPASGARSSAGTITDFDEATGRATVVVSSGATVSFHGPNEVLISGMRGSGDVIANHKGANIGQGGLNALKGGFGGTRIGGSIGGGGTEINLLDANGGKHLIFSTAAGVVGDRASSQLNRARPYVDMIDEATQKVQAEHPGFSSNVNNDFNSSVLKKALH